MIQLSAHSRGSSNSGTTAEEATTASRYQTDPERKRKHQEHQEFQEFHAKIHEECKLQNQRQLKSLEKIIKSRQL